MGRTNSLFWRDANATANTATPIVFNITLFEEGVLEGSTNAYTASYGPFYGQNNASQIELYPTVPPGKYFIQVQLPTEEGIKVVGSQNLSISATTAEKPQKPLYQLNAGSVFLPGVKSVLALGMCAVWLILYSI